MACTAGEFNVLFSNLPRTWCPHGFAMPDNQPPTLEHLAHNPVNTVVYNVNDHLATSGIKNPSGIDEG